MDEFNNKASHRGTRIQIDEGVEFKDGGHAARGKRLFYRATSRFGVCYALTGPQVLEDAKALIDGAQN